MPGLKKYLKRDGLLLVASLLLAVLVWTYVNDELTETRSVQVRLEIKVPGDLEVVSGALSSVRVTLRGPRGRMAALDPREVLARYELPAEAQGDVLVKLSEEDFIRLPEGVELAAPPESFSVKVGRLVPVRVKVIVRTEGEPAPGYAIIESPRAEPAQVLVRGRKGAVEKLTHVYTETLNVGDRREWLPTYVGIATEEGSGVYCSERVLVLMKIGKAPVPRDVPNIEVKVLSPPGFNREVTLETTSITLRIYGDPQRVTAVEARNILVMADVSGLAKLEKSTYEVQVELKLPAGISLAPGVSLPKVPVRLK